MDDVTESAVLGVMAILGVLLAITFFIGIAVAIRPDWMDRVRRLGGGRFSLSHATRVLDEPRNVDHILYRHHRAYGTLVVILAIFLLYFLAFVEIGGAWQKVLGIQNREVLAILGQWARFTLWLFAIFALMVGTIVFVRPSALKDFEQWANRWLAPRRLSKNLQNEYYFTDRSAGKHPKLWGMTVAILSGICLVAMYVQLNSAIGA